MDMREVLESMRINGLHDEAAAVGVVMQQRAELLEALKMLLEDADSTCETYYVAKALITRAEATE